MSLLASNGYKGKLLAAFPPIFNGGAIFLYGNTVLRPTSPNDVPAGAPIAVVTNEGLPWFPNSVGWGLQFLLNGPYVVGDSRQAWQIVPNLGATGVLATWWRLVAPGDSGIPSLTDARLDGNVGLKAAPGNEEILLDSRSLSPGTLIPLTSFYYTLPPIGT